MMDLSKLDKLSYEELCEVYTYVGKLKREKYRTSEGYLMKRTETLLKYAINRLDKYKNLYSADYIENVYDDIGYILKIKENTEKWEEK